MSVTTTQKNTNFQSTPLQDVKKILDVPGKLFYFSIKIFIWDKKVKNLLQNVAKRTDVHRGRGKSHRII